jgi:hypothetical protein
LDVIQLQVMVAAGMHLDVELQNLPILFDVVYVMLLLWLRIGTPYV